VVLSNVINRQDVLLHIFAELHGQRRSLGRCEVGTRLGKFFVLYQITELGDVVLEWHIKDVLFQQLVLGDVVLEWHIEDVLFQQLVLGDVVLEWHVEDVLFQQLVLGDVVLEWHVADVFFQKLVGVVVVGRRVVE